MCLICERIEMIKKETNPFFVRELQTGYVVLGDHQHFKGYTLFLCKEHQTELFQLDSEFAATFMEEMILVAEAVNQAFGAEKMNYECLGQGEAHLHWHLFPRKRAILLIMAIMVQVLSGGILENSCIMRIHNRLKVNYKC